MKHVTILRFLTSVGSAVSTLAALNLAGVANVVDPATAKYMLAVGPAALAVKELVIVLGDWFDDGKPNKSFTIGLFCAAMACLAFLFLPSCSANPGFSGSVSDKYGRVTLTPDGHIEVVVEPKGGK